MGRPRKPTEVLEFSGAFRKNPARRRARANEPKITTALGDPPREWLDGAELSGRFAALLSAWREIVAQDVLHVLNASHRDLVESTCYLKYKIRRASAGYGKSTSGDAAQLTANLRLMGMTPSDSSRVLDAVRGPKQEGHRGEWGELVG